MVSPTDETNGLNRRFALFWLLVVAALAAARFAHVHVLWAEEGYGSAAAVQILHGKMLYRDFWFDKPPLAALVYALWHGSPGWGLRLAGTIYDTGVAIAAYRLASGRWGDRTGQYAAALAAFFLIFGIPAAVTTLAPDLLLILPALAAVDCAARQRPFQSGLWCSLGLAVNAKALLLLPVCMVWTGLAGALPLLVGFAAGSAPWLIWLAASGALAGYWQQVWWFGSQYSRDTFVEHPWREGFLRTLNWLGFQAAIVVGAVCALWHEERRERARWFVWLGLGLLATFAGQRFFPRYYFALLAPVLVLGARGLATSGWRLRLVATLLLLIPLIRFGPRYVQLAFDSIQGRELTWADVQLDRDSRRAAALINRAAKSGDTLLVWGYRPDLFAYTQLPVEGRFLDSQLLTGVIADRHLTSTRPTFPEIAAQHRAQLITQSPTWIADGLGLLNPALAIVGYPELRVWIDRNYRVFASTGTFVVYRRVQQPERK